MRILIAPDKFKGSLTSAAAAAAIREGFEAAMPEAEFDLCPIADGGEGTADICADALGGERVDVDCADALGRPISARFGWVPSARMAVVEMSAASGLWRIAPGDREPLRSSSFGTGQLIRAALGRGARTVAVGLGGSATNDGGAGLAAALGWKFLSTAGRPVAPCPANLPEIVRIVPPARPAGATILGLADVRNPLLGERGCSRCYGPQKGASPADVASMEAALERFAALCSAQLQADFREAPGAGAAGGAGFGLMTFCDARVTSGFDWLSDLLDLDARVAAADLVVTGEGAIDAQTLEGKGPGALAALARKHGKRVIAFCGIAGPEAPGAFDGCFPLAGGAISPHEAVRRAAPLLRAEAFRVAGILHIGT